MSDWLDDAVREEGAVLFSDHPESRDLVRYQEAPSDLDETLYHGIAEHLRVCDACAEDLVRLQAANAELLSGGAEERAPGLRERLAGLLAPRFLIPALSLAVAAVAVFGPGGHPPAATPVGRSVVLKAETERGDAVTVSPDAGGRVSLMFTLPGDESGAVDRCSADVLDASGEIVAQLPRMTAFDAYGSFVLVLDTSGLSAGDYRLVARDRFGERTFPFAIGAAPRLNAPPTTP